MAEALRRAQSGIQIDLAFRDTLGDRDLTSPLWKLGDKGVFTKDFHQDLIDGKIDAVVHSWKDVELTDDNSTVLIPVLARADQRDLLLFKPESLNNSAQLNEIKIFSSSPRREYNLKSFLQTALPNRIQGKPIVFEPVRGNVQTRLNKWLSNPEASGIIIAKAAFDRLLSENFPESATEEFQNIRTFFRDVLARSIFMVLPLSENPNAPAQGALVAEIRSDRKDLIDLFNKLTVSESGDSVIQERKELKKYGGGCHQKIGVCVMHREYGKVFYLKGLTDDGVVLSNSKLENSRISPKAASRESIWPNRGEGLKFHRKPIENINKPIGALWVSRANAWLDSWKQENLQNVIWTAGLKTWKELAKKDIWVHGTSDGLGEKEPHRLDILVPEITFTKVTHKESDRFESDFSKCFTYETVLKEEIPDLKNKTHFFWMSASQFDLVLGKYPEIKNKHHASGPGLTKDHIEKVLGHSIDVFLSFEEWLEFHGVNTF